MENKKILKTDNNKIYYLVKFKNDGVKHHRTFSVKNRDEIKSKLYKLGFYSNLEIIEITKIIEE